MYLARAISLLDSALRAETGKVSGLEQQIVTYISPKSKFPCSHIWMFSILYVRMNVCSGWGEV